MEMLKSGQFFGSTSHKLTLAGLVLTDTEYLHPYVDWHYHENAYFTFLLQGKVLEGNKGETFRCVAGDLLYHNWQEAHYNIKPDGYTRGFHIELTHEWFARYDIPPSILEGSVRFEHPELKLMMYRLFRLSKQKRISEASIDVELINFYSLASRITDRKESSRRPEWVIKLADLLEEPYAHDMSLQELALAVEVHPVHLSRTFARYFHQNLSDYLQFKKIEHAMRLIPGNQNKLASIAAECGFADQSHFIRAFKKCQGVTPKAFQKLFDVTNNSLNP